MNTYQGDARHLAPGNILHERYLVGRALGEDDFDITYIGWDRSLEIRVVVKEYFPARLAVREADGTARGTVSVPSGGKEEEYQDGLEKFLEETRRLAKYRNTPGIAGVSDFFKENGTAYMIMDYMDGVSQSGDMLEKSGATSGKQPARALRWTAGRKGMVAACAVLLAIGVIGGAIRLGGNEKVKEWIPKETPMAKATISPQEAQYRQTEADREQGLYEKAAAIYKGMPENMKNARRCYRRFRLILRQ